MKAIKRQYNCLKFSLTIRYTGHISLCKHIDLVPNTAIEW